MKKKLLILLLSVTVLLLVAGTIWALLEGLGRTEAVIKLDNGTYVNLTYNSEQMTDISGDAFILKGNNLAYAEHHLGFGFAYTEKMAEINDRGKLCAVVAQPYAVSFTYVTDQSAALYGENKDSQGMIKQAAAEFWQEMAQTSFAYAGVFRCPGDDPSAEAAYTAWAKSYAFIEEICDYQGDIYLFGYNTNYANLELTAEEHVDLAALIAERDSFKNRMCIFRRGTATVDQPLEFSARTLDGETVTEDIFRDYRLTMINIWATGCQPCIEEMPELQELHEQLPAGVNLVTIVTAQRGHPELVREIYEDAGGAFMVIFPDENLEDSLLAVYNTVPTTVFVDADGNIVGRPQVGTPAPPGRGRLVQAYLDLINERLEAIE